MRDDYELRRGYEKKHKARVTIGVLSFLPGAFFLLIALFLWSASGRIEEDVYLLDFIPPLMVLGVALLTVTLIAILIPIKAPGGPPWRMMHGIGRGMDRGRGRGMMRGVGRGMDLGMAWRIALLVVLFFGFIVFTNIWLFFFAGGLYADQKITIVIVALLVFGGVGAAVLASMWLRW